ncbi:hypothetical protein [Methylobacterium sp.]|uniref:hypothetical protein n=1 Tax=Methylobacterium sp. TaxID=409 RepID=UPI003B58E1E6
MAVIARHHPDGTTEDAAIEMLSCFANLSALALAQFSAVTTENYLQDVRDMRTRYRAASLAERNETASATGLKASRAMH